MILAYKNKKSIIKIESEHDGLCKYKSAIKSVLISWGLIQFTVCPFRWRVVKVHGRETTEIGPTTEIYPPYEYKLEQGMIANVIQNGQKSIAYTYYDNMLVWFLGKYADVPSALIIEYKGKQVSVWVTPKSIGFKEGDTFIIYNNKEFSYGTMDVFLRNLNGETVTFKVHPKCITLDLMYLRHTIDKGDIEYRRLIFDGKQMEHGRTMSFYGVKHKSTILHVYKLHGS